MYIISYHFLNYPVQEYIGVIYDLKGYLNSLTAAANTSCSPMYFECFKYSSTIEHTLFDSVIRCNNFRHKS